jgi:Tol biopolymer transport system component
MGGVLVSGPHGWALFAVSETGTLVYGPGPPHPNHVPLIVTGRDGGRSSLPVPERSYYRVRVSPDRTRLVLGIDDANSDIWTYDLRRSTLTRLTSGWDNDLPVWSADGERVFFQSNRDGDAAIYAIAADGSGAAERLHQATTSAAPESASPDGRYLAFLEERPATGPDIRLLSLAPPHEATDFLATDATEYEPAFSPDGGFLAYTSTATGRAEVYVTTYPEPSARWQISNAGGMHPMWSLDGRELYYILQDVVMAVEVESTSPFTPGTPFERTRLPDRLPEERVSRFCVSPNGKGFISYARKGAPVTSLGLVLHWADTLDVAGD